jgi:hypothetical protein
MPDQTLGGGIFGGARPWTDPRSSFLGPSMRSFPAARARKSPNPKNRRVEAAAGVEAQNAPTPAWKPQNGFHELPHASSFFYQFEGGQF